MFNSGEFHEEKNSYTELCYAADISQTNTTYIILDNITHKNKLQHYTFACKLVGTMLLERRLTKHRQKM